MNFVNFTIFSGKEGKRGIAAFFLIFLGSLTAETLAQISIYEDCSELALEDSKDQPPSTFYEKINKLEDWYYPEVSSVDKCNPSTFSSGESQQGGGGADAQQGMGGNAGTKPAGKTHGTNNYFNNQLAPEETSIPITNEMFPVAISAKQQKYLGDGSNKPDLISVGSKHEKLDVTDNTAALKAQLERAMDEEKDPVIKRNLKQRIEALK
ncbi:hypothetical protein OAL10_10905 [Gammaproteobacteria bacterium]|nr:hypothetical protein [Gammaproteobacteria bacterium]